MEKKTIFLEMVDGGTRMTISTRSAVSDMARPAAISRVRSGPYCIEFTSGFGN